MATTQDYINQLKLDKQNLVSMLNSKGVEASNSETFTSLTPKVGTIVTDPNLQSKFVTITENGTQNITYDEGYDGLSSVEVTTNVPSGGDVPEIGFIVNEWDSDGYPTSIQIINKKTIGSIISGAKVKNITIPQTAETISDNALQYYGIEEMIIPTNVKSIGSSAFRSCKSLKSVSIESTNYSLSLNGYQFEECTSLLELDLSCMNNTDVPRYICNNNTSLKKVILPTNATSINVSCFNFCTNLSEINNLENITSISDSGFRNCQKISTKSFQKLTSVSTNGLERTYGITQLSLPSIVTLNGSSGYNGSFLNNTSLKAIWIGENIKNTLPRYTFYGCSNLTKIFINLPRATVEGFKNYQYAFMNNTNKTGIIVCNDDEGFMTCEEFDAIDWSTYTG